MNRPIPKLGSVKTPSEFSEKFFTGFSHIALPISSENNEVVIGLTKKEIKSLEEIFAISFTAEIKKHGSGITAKPGEAIDIPILKDDVTRILLVGMGAASDSDIRKAGAALGRNCLLYTSPSPRDGLLSRMQSSA